jgi:transcriptional regulator GlxA family with amidase domain
VATEQASLTVSVERSLDDLTDPDIIVVPGGAGTRRIVADGGALVEWVAGVHAGTQFTTSVCTGSLVLGAAGLLVGLEATTHWAVLASLARFGATPVSRRVVRQGKVITAAGVSAGIDMALTLAAIVAGEDVAKLIQLAIEYDPEPPFDAGSPAKAGPELAAIVEGRTPPVPV